MIFLEKTSISVQKIIFLEKNGFLTPLAALTRKVVLELLVWCLIQNYLLQSLIIAEALSKVYRLMLVKNCNVSLSFNC